MIDKGDGPVLLLIHGSGTDYRTWSIQLATLTRHFRVIAYDRHGAFGRRTSVAAQAEDAAEILASRAGGPALVCGSSFGGVVALELCRRYPDLVRGLIACEPPMPPSDAIAPAPPGFGCYFDRLACTHSGPDAAEMFLRAVLSDAAFEAMSPAWQKRTREKWQEIRADIFALTAYAARYHLLDALDVPVLLLSGEKSPPVYRLTLEVLAGALADAQLEIIPGAGHMMHAESHRAFNRAVLRFAEAISQSR